LLEEVKDALTKRVLVEYLGKLGWVLDIGDLLQLLNQLGSILVEGG
jgi:hypothetical protein